MRLSLKYTQTYIPEKIESGNCWIDSIAAPLNEKAWRCMTTGNMIYDPCFETESKEMVCGVDPHVPSGGFILKLTKELPKRTVSQQKESEALPWIAELQNGLTCETLTGTGGDVNGEVFNSACDRYTVILGDIDKSKPLWMARVAFLSDDIKQATKIEMVVVTKVWR